MGIIYKYIIINKKDIYSINLNEVLENKSLIIYYNTHLFFFKYSMYIYIKLPKIIENEIIDYLKNDTYYKNLIHF